MNQQTWWQRPQLRDDEVEGDERRVTWLELFFDLVFVVVIAELSHMLAGHINLVSLGSFIFLFIPVWWAWVGATFYTDRFETEDISVRVFTFLQMLTVAAMAIFVHDALGETSAQFALAYAAFRGVLVFLWWRVGRHNPHYRSMAQRITIGFSISVILFVVSVFIPPPARFAFWAIGLFVDLVTPWIVRGISRINVDKQTTSPKMIERFGLFTIIVLGETIVGVVQGVAQQHNFIMTTAIVGVLGMALAFSIWWIYFEFVALRRVKVGPRPSLAWTYLHLPLVMSIAATGAAIGVVIADEGGPVESEARWLISLAVSTVFLTTGFLGLTLQQHILPQTVLRTSFWLKVAGGVLALAIGWWGGSLSAIALLSLLLLLLFINIGHSFFVRYGQSPGGESNLEDVLD